MSDLKEKYLIKSNSYMIDLENVDVFDIKSDTIRTLIELGINENDLDRAFWKFN